MSASGVTVRGTLKPDGTLELDEKLNLPAGRVQVTVQPLTATAAPAEDWWEYLQRARAEREASGYPFMTEQEGQAYIEDLRSGDERLDEIYRQAEERRGRQE